jgi:hypothetical protein
LRGQPGFDVAVGWESRLVRFELNGPDGRSPLEDIFLGAHGVARGSWKRQLT